MKYLFIPFLLFSSFAYSLEPSHKVGNICHSEHAEFNYAGVWELSLKGNLICNYWQFLSDQARASIESQLDEYGEFFIQHIQNDEDNDDEYDGYWEVDDLDESDWNTEPEEEQETIIEQ